MFSDEALDSVSIQSVWRKSQQSAQESVCLRHTTTVAHSAISMNHSVLVVYSYRIIYVYNEQTLMANKYG